MTEFGQPNSDDALEPPPPWVARHAPGSRGGDCVVQGSEGHRTGRGPDGSTKARLSWDKALIAGFLAGAYIAIAGLLAIVVSAGMPQEWGGLPTLVTGAVFSLGLILVVIAGSELLTGNMALSRALRDIHRPHRRSRLNSATPACMRERKSAAVAEQVTASCMEGSSKAHAAPLPRMLERQDLRFGAARRVDFVQCDKTGKATGAPAASRMRASSGSHPVVAMALIACVTDAATDARPSMAAVSCSSDLSAQRRIEGGSRPGARVSLVYAGSQRSPGAMRPVS